MTENVIGEFIILFAMWNVFLLTFEVQRQAQAQQQGLAQGIPRQQLIQQPQQPQQQVLIRGQVPAGLTPQQQLQWLQQHQQRQLQGQTVVINQQQQQQQQQQLLQQNAQLRQQQVKMRWNCTVSVMCSYLWSSPLCCTVLFQNFGVKVKCVI